MASHETDPRVFPSTAAPTARAIPAAEPACPLSEADFRLLHEAAGAYRPVRKAARTAMISAVTILVVAVLAVPITLLSPSFTNLVVAIGLSIVGYLEYAGAGKMRLGQPEAASHLGWNQVMFICLICIYCTVQMLNASDDYLSPETRGQLSQVPEVASQIVALVPAAVRGFYLLVMLLSIVLQGSLAWYYFSRRRHLETLQRSTPAWIQRTFREIGGC